MAEWSMNPPPVELRGYVKFVGEFGKTGKMTVNPADWGGPRTGYNYEFTTNKPTVNVWSSEDFDWFNSFRGKAEAEKEVEVACGPGGKGTRKVIKKVEVDTKIFEVKNA